MAKKYYRKPHRYKKKKPFFRKKFFALGFLVAAAVAAVFYGLFLWRIFWVEKIIVSGEEKIGKEEIEFWVEKNLENKIMFFDTRSIIAVDTGNIREEILNAFPAIADVEVKKSFFDAVSVRVTERAASALWCENNICFLLDGGGVIFEEAPSESSLLVIEKSGAGGELSLGETVIAQDKLDQIFRISSGIAEAAGLSAEKALIVSEERLDIEISEGWSVYFNLKKDLDWQVTELALVLEKEVSSGQRKILEYIDLRFSRVYIKPEFTE